MDCRKDEIAEWIYPYIVIGDMLAILCTYDLYGPVRNAFDAGSIHYLGKWEGVGPWKTRVFWGLYEMAQIR